MPHKLKVLSGDELVKFFGKQGFFLRSMNGSHMKLVRHTDKGDQTIIIPRHKPVQKGTLKGIYNEVKIFIDQKDLDDFFYTK